MVKFYHRTYSLLGHFVFTIIVFLMVFSMHLMGVSGLYFILFASLVMLTGLPLLNIFYSRQDHLRRDRENVYISPEKIDLIFRSETLDQLVSETFEKMLSLFSVSKGVIVIFNIHTQNYEVYERSGGSGCVLTNPVITKDNPLLKYFSENRKTVIRKMFDSRQENVLQIIEELDHFNAEIAAPIIYSEQILGMLMLEGRAEKFSARDIEIIQSFASKIGIVYMNGFLWKETVRKKDIEKEFELGRKMQNNFNPPESGIMGGYEFHITLHRGHGTFRQYCDLYSELGDLSVTLFTNDDMTPGSFVFLPSIIPLTQFYFRKGASPSEVVSKVTDTISLRGIAEAPLMMSHFHFSDKGVSWARTGFGDPLLYDLDSGNAFLAGDGKPEGSASMGRNLLMFILDEDLSVKSNGLFECALQQIRLNKDRGIGDICIGIASAFGNLSGKNHFVAVLRSAR
jgi:hypothetical protein